MNALLATTTGDRPLGGAAAPAWFSAALDVPVEIGAVEVDGATIAYRRWGNRETPPVVLVHGGGANSRWWDHIAPLVAIECDVVALDLSGHGDSSHRSAYSFATWAKEILTLATSFAHHEPPVVIGHSMGGMATVEAAATAGDLLKGIVVIDSPIKEISPEELAGGLKHAFGPRRVYPTVDDALARFHTVPDQPDSLPYVIDHVARTSLETVEGGWRWKFDPGFTSRGIRPGPQTLARVPCRFALVRAEFGMVTAEMGRMMHDQIGDEAIVVEVPDAYHHILLDQPLALVTAVRTILAAWRHGLPGGAAET
jgi:pimeloyl-ACP methyl ester carboxylesterase